MEQYRKPMFFIKNGLSLFQNKQISILEIGFGTVECIYYFFGRNKMNQSIDYVGAYPFPRKNCFHELRRRIECFESQGVFDKMHQSNGEKRESRR
jgi:hypothetical protein